MSYLHLILNPAVLIYDIHIFSMSKCVFILRKLTYADDQMRKYSLQTKNGLLIIN